MLFEPGRNGAKAVRQAAELMTRAQTDVTVVTLAPQECKRCCGPSSEPFNCAVRKEAVLELREAWKILGPMAERATFKVLVGQREPLCSKRRLSAPLALWVAKHAFDLVFLPRHRLTPGGHSVARKVRRSTATEVRIVG